MEKKILFKVILILALLMPGVSLSSQDLELPLTTDQDGVVRHKNYSLQYVEELELAAWVAYELTAEEVRGTAFRRDDFKSDPLVKTGSARESDYRGSGFDRGHLAPAGDMKISPEVMRESFYMSNMAPQRPSFNRGIWLTLENTVRTWAVENGGIFVVTGPVLNQPSYQRIGSSGVAVPEYFYKVILDYRQPELKAIGFILPNQKGSRLLAEYAVSVDEVERVTGINFYHSLADSVEEELESSFDTSLWTFKEYRGESQTAHPQPGPPEGEALYWINTSSNTRHNASSRYYGNTKQGYYTNDPVGKAGEICGG